ncbi:helix-turn-helix domain-containing protein [Paraburkholderia fungorum]|jgi:AraC-like DNA-binding protein|uniref:Helix-turn-helix domain-containing protein n=1 Tax=Paraburkholderia fungorum TaxID=134537 RepID=A0AAP5Q9Z7_9BURK|nr:helix-turn-helix domain-containing protein [Paraburkholderia fungorum]MDT8838339.1 helix-turn-helix domain-containing protein [Paraburkholderia fungorum]PRZ51820.1 AraC family transcriptional regulator [Paraburkholderia fungorum]
MTGTTMNRAPVLISTERVAPNARLAFWQTNVANLLTHLECSSAVDEGFSGSITAHLSSPINLIEIVAASHTIARIKPKISQIGEEQVFVCIQVTGEAIVEQDNRRNVLRQGDITFLDTSKTFRAEFPEATSQLVLQIPRTLVRKQVGAIEHLTATIVTTDNPLSNMTRDFVNSLAQNFESFSADIAQRLTAQAIDMAMMAFMSRPEDKSTAAPTNTVTRAMLAYRGRAFIETNLRNHSLAPADVAEHLGISKRYLSSVFASDGQSVERYIWERRLARCARDLEDPGQVNRAIGDIASSWGFNNLTHFSQSFKMAFGKTPREFRKG